MPSTVGPADEALETGVAISATSEIAALSVMADAMTPADADARSRSGSRASAAMSPIASTPV